MATFGVPCTWNAFETVGLSTRIGIGDVASNTPQIAVAPTLCFVIPADSLKDRRTALLDDLVATATELSDRH